MCTCREDFDVHLKEHNTRIAVSFVLTRDLSGMDALPMIVTEKLDTRKRPKAKVVVASYCPFCGVKYPRKGDEK